MAVSGKPIALIPARGGSKRIPKKNIRLFNGIPMLSHSIKAAQDSGLFHEIHVSTDSEDIRDIAIAQGAKVPQLRPKNISDDHAPLFEVIEHHGRALENEGHTVDQLCCILATSPLLQPKFLAEGHNILNATPELGSVYPIVPFDYPILRALKHDEQGNMAMQWPEHIVTRSNDLPEFYHDAGQFYWLRMEVFYQTLNLLTEKAKGFIIPRRYVVDIDTPEDWELAELQHKILSSTI